MDFKAPKLRKITESSAAATLQLNSDFWEISVPPRDDVVWSIVLSYLISEDFKPPQDLHDRLNILTGDDSEEKAIEQVIKSFNPFQDKNSCFENDAMKKVVLDFKKKLNREMLDAKTDTFQAASSLLKNPIYVIDDDGKLFDTSINIQECSFDERETIVLFSSSESRRRVLKFGINADFCRKKRKAALFQHLNRGNFFRRKNSLSHSEGFFSFETNANLGRKKGKTALLNNLKRVKTFRRSSLSHLKCLVTDEEDVLISLLKSKYSNLVPDLLDSPSVISKAIELGYLFDIRSVDSDGFSPLYHAIMSCDTRICYSVYHFALKSFQCCESYRRPTFQNLHNLQKIEDILLIDQTKSKDFEDIKNSETAEILFYSLLSLNSFLKKFEKDDPKSPDRVVLSAIKEQKNMLMILDTYLKFSDSITVRKDIVSLQDDLNGFIKFKSYCQAIDSLTCLFFFDNIHKLKKKLPRPNIYPDIESNFFILALTYKMFDIQQLSGHFQVLHSFSGRNINIIYEILLTIRNNIVTKVKDFRDYLSNVDILQITSPKKTHKEFGLILRSYRKIRNYLEAKRLKSYLNTAENIQRWSKTSMLPTERVLQVIGENMIENPVHEKRFEWFLYLYLPQDIGQILFDLRNSLSHYEFSSFSSRIRSEYEFSNFIGIHREISVLHDYLKPFFNIINLHINAHINKILKFCINRLNIPKIYRKKLTMNRLVHFIPKTIFTKCHSDIHHVFRVILSHIECEKAQRTTSEQKLIYPLKRMIRSVQELQLPNEKKLLEKSKFSNLFPFLNALKENTVEFKSFLDECKTFVATKRRVTENIEITDIGAILSFQLSLTSTVLTDLEKDDIMREVPLFVWNFLAEKDALKEFIQDESRLDYRNFFFENPQNYSTFLSNDSDRLTFSDLLSKYSVSSLKLAEYCQIKNDDDVYNIIKAEISPAGEHAESDMISDAIQILENAFLRNYMTLTEYTRICRVIQFSNDTRKLLRKLCVCRDNVEDEIEQKLYESKYEGIKQSSFKLKFLLDRIQLMQDTLMWNSSESLKLWKYDESRHYRSHGITKKYKFLEIMADLLLINSEVKASIEMMLFDCMEVSGRTDDQSWLKTSGMYEGIYLRNVMAHGDLLLENLCELSDPLDLPLEIIKKVVDLIRDKDCIEAILKFYKMVDENIFELKKKLSYPTNDQEKLLSKLINKSGNKQRYIDILKVEEENE